MIAQVKPTAPTLVALTSDGLDEMNADDLAMLSTQIDDLLTAKDRGDDITLAYLQVKKVIKCLAIEFGIVSEIFDRQEAQLQSSGLRSQILPIAQ